MRRRALWLLVALGAALRLGLYFSRPSLSIDETMTSLEIGARSFAGLLHPLAYAQTAPPLFLWGVKLCTLIGGMNEYALRIVPLIGGLLVPYLVWRVGLRVLDPAAALLATGIASAAPTLVQYSVIAKPYMTDAVIALILAQSTLGALDHPRERGAWVWLGVAGLAAVLGSIAAPFLLSGAGVALLLGLKPRTAGSAMLAAFASVWGVVFILLYSSLYRPVATSSYMQQFWSGAFLTPLHLSGWELAGRAVIQSLVARPIPAVLIPLVILLFVAGFAILARRAGRAPATLLGIPVLAVLIASPLHRYPLSARVLLGVAPTLALCAAASLVAVTYRRRLIGAGMGALVVTALALVNVLHPYRTPALRPAIRAIAASASGDPVYISSGAIPAWALYTTDWSSPDTGYLGRIRRWSGIPDAPGFHNLAPRRRAVTVADAPDSGVRRLGRVEILGLAPGIQWREVVGLSGRSPDAGWAATEAARIKLSGPTVWLLIATAYAGTRDSLFAALDGVGGRIEVDSVVGGVERSRVNFVRPP